MKALSQIDTDDITYEELTERFEAVKTSTVDCMSAVNINCLSLCLSVCLYVCMYCSVSLTSSICLYSHSIHAGSVIVKLVNSQQLRVRKLIAVCVLSDIFFKMTVQFSSV